MSSFVWSSRLGACDEGRCCLWMYIWVSTLAQVVLLSAIPLVSAVSDLEGLVVCLSFTSLSGCLGLERGRCALMRYSGP